jgi:DMSO/TMAO reductase YedYZ molybdopterin-dependent catalytic subunit
MLDSLANLTTRRKWMGATALAGGALAATVGGVELLRFRRTAADEDPFQGGKLVGNLMFEDEGRAPLDTLLGDELDGRRFTDLGRLDGDNLETPTDLFYVRTRASHLLDASRPWSIQVASPAGDTRVTVRRVSISELRSQAEPQGLHLLECAGNTRTAHFGLISVAAWDGVPLSGWLDRMRFDKDAGILVSGFDQYAAKPLTPSVPGASWIFSRHDIEDSGAFLATSMNGEPLTPDHGAPVRLVVPGWYGCACIKWVNMIGPVDEAAEPTSQMQEYAARTHQRGLPARASEYQPATIDPAAMPVRIEKWLVAGKVKFKVIGIVWGGLQPADNLQIRFRPEEPYVPVSRVQPAANSPWGLWTHVWAPRQPGVYRIRLRLADPSIRTRRLDTGFYVRQVEIDRI